MSRLFFAIATLLIATPSYSDSLPDQMALGWNHVCELNSGKVTCEGRDDHKQLEVPKDLGVVQEIATSHDSICAIDENGIHCWGDYDEFTKSYGLIQTEVPEVKNPRNLTLGSEHACVISGKDKVVCWGSDSRGINSPPEIQNPIQISAGSNHTCALDNKQKVHCWGYNPYKQSEVPKFPKSSRIKKISSGDHHSCAIGSDWLRCWGDNSLRSHNIEISGLGELIDVVAGHSLTCVTGTKGTACAGYNYRGQADVPITLQSSLAELYVGPSYACGIDRTADQPQKTCWGKDPRNSNRNIEIEKGTYVGWIEESYSFDDNDPEVGVPCEVEILEDSKSRLGKTTVKIKAKVFHKRTLKRTVTKEFKLTWEKSDHFYQFGNTNSYGRKKNERAVYLYTKGNEKGGLYKFSTRIDEITRNSMSLLKSISCIDLKKVD